MFLYGFRSSRFFSRNIYIWDFLRKLYFKKWNTYFRTLFLVKCKEHFEANIQQQEQTTQTNEPANRVHNASQRNEMAVVWRYYVHLLNEINAAGNTLGKDGKFQLFICLSLR